MVAAMCDTPEGEGFTPSPVPSLDETAGIQVIRDVEGATRLEWKGQMYASQGGRCWYCDCAMDCTPPAPYVPTPPDFATFEHLIPIRKRVRVNGKTIGYYPDTPDYLLSRANLVLACYECNTTRGTTPLPDFIAFLREKGKRLGIVSRIKHLVGDTMPEPWQAEAFASWMQEVLDRPAPPTHALNG